LYTIKVRCSYPNKLLLTSSKLKGCSSVSCVPAMAAAAWQPISRAWLHSRIWNQWGAVQAGSTVQQSPAAKTPAGQQQQQ
jgi:hypothetical protein